MTLGERGSQVDASQPHVATYGAPIRSHLAERCGSGPARRATRTEAAAQEQQQHTSSAGSSKHQYLKIKMVNFGKKLMADQIPEWKGYYINYKLMKKKVKQYGQQLQQGEKDRRRVLKDFSKMLDDQIEKIVLFLLEQQGLLASRIEKLGKQRAILQEQPDISGIAELREAYREVGINLIKLLKFVDLNATGIRKILKKFDKRFGYRFTDYYVTSRSNHPYSQLQQVFKHVGVGAVVGALSRNLAELQERQGSYLSIYDQPSSALKDPIIDMINSSVDKLTRSTNFLRFLGQHAMIVDEESPSTAGEEEIEDQKYHFMSLMLNLVNTFLYMVNTYIIVPTADDYSVSLGAASTVCGVVIGSMAVAQIFSSIYFSAWSNKSYFKPLVFSSIVLFLGNICYAMAYDMKSLTVLIIGRLLCGMGSARAVNRRYISDCVPARIRMQASAGFVSASALGMACGPALAGLLQWKFKVYMVTFNQSTLPGWVMAVAWLLYLIWLWFSFKEPNRATEVNEAPQNPASGQTVDIGRLENGIAQPLLKDSVDKQNEDEDEVDDIEETADDSRKPATSIGSAYRLLTPSVKVQLLIYFMLKYAMEILLSESSVITNHYFSWNTSAVAIFLAILGLTVLPVNAVVGTYISNMFEDRQLLMVSQITLLVGIIFSFKVTSTYYVVQYVVSALVTFVSAEVLEGVNLSLLSSVMSSRLSRGTYNGGLLSTEAGTLARVVADCTITAAGYLGVGKLLNVTLLPSLVICVASIACTFLTYNSLF
ncbi:SPX domain-containing membrane protein [Zea mays]|uniref:SPX domain-containing membrane protein n=3 Tax=Zea mays TaxID=4577 RepID=A0A1D6NWA4_MAIZE|nr:SPX domain-containing membrane protein [Zea mays]